MQAQIKIVDDADCAYPSASAQEVALHALKKHRQAVLDRATGLTEACNRLSGAEEAERAAVAAIGELGKAETAAMTEWASNGAAGDPPAPDMVQRRELGERLGAAQAAAAAAKGAAAGIQDELASVHTDLQGIDDRIEAAALEIMAGEAAPLAAKLEQAGKVFAKMLAEAQAAPWAMAERGRNLISNGDQAAGTIWLRQAEALAIPLADPWPDPGVVDEARAEWLRHFGELIA